MIAAMGLLPEETAVTSYAVIGATGNLPPAKIYVILGADALKALLPGVPIHRGVFNKLAGREAMCTMSPDFMMRFHANDPAQLRADKLAVWAELKMVLARLGRTPPVRKKG